MTLLIFAGSSSSPPPCISIGEVVTQPEPRASLAPSGRAADVRPEPRSTAQVSTGSSFRQRVLVPADGVPGAASR